jgi:hypothetical protein
MSPFKDGKPTSATAAIKSWAKWLQKYIRNYASMFRPDDYETKKILR